MVALKRLFTPPAGWTLVADFVVPRVHTWGDTNRDKEYKSLVRQSASLPPNAGVGFAAFVFSIRCVVGESRRRRVGPDVENIPKLIVDAFTGILFPDDNLDHVRGVQVEAIFGSDADEAAEVTIYGIR